MSGIDAGILVKAHPLTEEQIKQLEKKVLENRDAFAYLNENKELCFAIPQGVDQIKELAWHKTSELYIDEENTFIKKVYRRYTPNSYALDTVLQKQNLDDSWGQPGSGGSTAPKKTTWEAKAWSGFTGFLAEEVWFYDNNIYVYNSHCNIADPISDYILNKETDSWEDAAFAWSEALNPRGARLQKPWSYRHNLYRSAYCQSGGVKLFVLNTETNTWEVTAEEEGMRVFNKQYTFTDGKDTYGTDNTTIYKFNKEADMWELWKETIWNEADPYDPGALWFFKGNVYYSMGSDKQYILNQETNTWEVQTWNGDSDLWGAYFWTDGVNMYYLESNPDRQYVLDTETNTWNDTGWSDLPEAYSTRHSLWTDGENIYISTNGHYVLV